jgi:hypothetical protein
MLLRGCGAAQPPGSPQQVRKAAGAARLAVKDLPSTWSFIREME